eukprot:265045_1
MTMVAAVCALLICVLLSMNSVNGQDAYPVWPSPSFWNGTFKMHEPVNAEGTLEMCYDFKNQQFAKAFHATSNSSDTFTYKLLFLGAIQYNICYGPG